ncbi:MAG: sensor histidine kinase [Brooklawnia sp.]|jgi:two-component system NtrC family sensor kinase
MTQPIAVIIARSDIHEQMLAEFRHGIGDQALITSATNIEAAIEANHPEVALVLLDCRGTRVDDLIVPLKQQPAYANARVLAVVDNQVDDAEESLDKGWVAAFIGLPITPGLLASHSSQQLIRWQVHYGPDADPDASGFTMVPRSDLLRDFHSTQDSRTAELIAAIDRALGPRPRVQLPAGIRLTRQERPSDGVYVILEGEVALTRRVGEEDMLFHQNSTGSVVGILALTTQASARFTSITTTPCVVVHLSTYQLDQALQMEPQVSAFMASSAITQLGRRLAHSAQQLVERRVLIHQLRQERAELTDALAQLRDARMELITQARFATLGELSAGIAHELNNPVAALLRSTEHLFDDITSLLRTNPQGELITRTIDASVQRNITSTREQRAARRELAKLIGDDDLARRLSAAGVTDPEVARAATTSEELATTIELSAKLGTSLRAINLAAEHITRLVSSLRSYSRPDADPVDGVSVNASIEDTLTLVSHRLGGVTVQRDYDDLPGIRARQAQLGQVWTNILVNAADALEGSGTIKIRTQKAGHEIIASIIDNGPGIPEEILERVFEPHFTTKHGRVRFGMGMGLGIAAHFVNDHGGRIEIESRPGRTKVNVRLPVAGPPDAPATIKQESP